MGRKLANGKINMYSDKKTTIEIEKVENKTNQNRDIEGKYSDQVLCRPNVVKMRKTLIFTSDPEKIKEGLATLSNDEKEKAYKEINEFKQALSGKDQKANELVKHLH